MGEGVGLILILAMVTAVKTIALVISGVKEKRRDKDG